MLESTRYIQRDDSIPILLEDSKFIRKIYKDHAFSSLYWVRVCLFSPKLGLWRLISWTISSFQGFEPFYHTHSYRLNGLIHFSCIFIYHLIH